MILLPVFESLASPAFQKKRIINLKSSGRSYLSLYFIYVNSKRMGQLGGDFAIFMVSAWNPKMTTYVLLTTGLPPRRIKFNQ